ncbi:MAG: ATP-binding cassette domain-containing protein [Streptosporangiales bacterium]|nr:ATP-binding cassette domain-containing protein [Streptosporangiales bacterium]
MAAGSPPAVEVDDLTKRYGEHTAVDGVGLTVRRGSVTAVLGPNGAGKTTTVECCEGFRRPDAGTVRVLGLDPLADGRALRPRIGVMLQAGGVYPAARPRELLRTVARCHARPHDPDALLELLGLTRVARTPYRRLSGGEQQRLGLALALVGRPEVAFLDEPTAGLDPQARHATWDVIAGLRDAGASVLLTTHYLEEAERLADDVVIIDRGRVLASGAPDQLTGSPDDRLSFRAPGGLDTTDLLATLPAGTTVTEAPSGHYLLHRTAGPVDPATLAAVTSWCAKRNVLAADLGVERRTLEDVFLELTGRELRP